MGWEVLTARSRVVPPRPLIQVEHSVDIKHSNPNSLPAVLMLLLILNILSLTLIMFVSRVAIVRAGKYKDIFMLKKKLRALKKKQEEAQRNYRLARARGDVGEMMSQHKIIESILEEVEPLKEEAFMRELKEISNAT